MAFYHHWNYIGLKILQFHQLHWKCIHTHARARSLAHTYTHLSYIIIYHLMLTHWMVVICGANGEGGTALGWGNDIQHRNRFGSYWKWRREKTKISVFDKCSDRLQVLILLFPLRSFHIFYLFHRIFFYSINTFILSHWINWLAHWHEWFLPTNIKFFFKKMRFSHYWFVCVYEEAICDWGGCDGDGGCCE